MSMYDDEAWANKWSFLLLWGFGWYIVASWWFGV